MFPFPTQLYLLSFKRTHHSCWGLGWGGGGGGAGGEAWVGGGGCNRWKYTLTPRTDTPEMAITTPRLLSLTLTASILNVQLCAHFAHNSREPWGFW